MLALEERDVTALYGLALLYDKQGKEVEAEKYYLLAIEKGVDDALNGLALLYAKQGKEVEAENYYLLAIERGDELALYNLLVMYYLQNKKSKVVKLVNIQSQVKIDKLGIKNFDFATILCLYVGEFSKFINMSESYIKGEKEISSLLIERLLIHKQYNWVFNYFVKNPSAIELYTPLYYSTLFILGDKEQEILKMPPEIKENVDNIMEYIMRQQKYYME